MVEVLSDDEAGDATTSGGEPTNVIHALTGIQPRHDRTMQLQVDINGMRLLVLLKHTTSSI
jgi:hypothetical protein